MNEDNFFEISNDVIILLDKTGLTDDGIDEIVGSLSSEFAYKFHRILVSRRILLGDDGSQKWFKEGFPSQILEPGSVWKKGRLRLRVVPEFVLDEESESYQHQEIEPSLDEFRE